MTFWETCFRSCRSFRVQTTPQRPKPPPHGCKLGDSCPRRLLQLGVGVVEEGAVRDAWESIASHDDVKEVDRDPLHAAPREGKRKEQDHAKSQLKNHNKPEYPKPEIPKLEDAGNPQQKLASRQPRPQLKGHTLPPKQKKHTQTRTKKT